MTRALPALALALALAAGPAAATSPNATDTPVTATAEGAAALAERLEGAGWSFSASLFPIGQIRVPGSITVEPAGDHYRVTVPATEILQAGRTLVERDPTVYQFRPEGEGLWRFTQPAEAYAGSAFDEEQVERGRTTIDTVSISGLWDAALGFVTRAEGEARGYRDRDLLTGTVVTVAETTTRRATEPGAGETVRITDTEISRGFAMTGILGGGNVTIGAIGVDIGLEGVRLPALSAAMETLYDPDLPAARAPEVLRGLDMEGAFLRVTAADLGYDMPESGLTGTIGGIGLELDGRSATAGDRTRLQYRVDGIALELEVPEAGGLVPTALEIDLTAEGVAVETLRDLTLTGPLAEADWEDPASLQIIAPVLLIELFRLQPQVSLGRLAIEAPLVGLEAFGSLSVDPNARLGVTGVVAASVRGIDAAFEHIARRPEMAAAGPALAALRGLGRPDAEAGRHAYDIEITAEGQLMINGLDFGAMVAGLREAERTLDRAREDAEREDAQDEGTEEDAADGAPRPR